MGPAISTAAPQLSKMRTFLLWALAVVWFSEMTMWGVRPLAEWWTVFWQQLAPDDPRLATALFLTHALEAAAKGALGVLAVFALRSGSPSVRTALFVPMALVPPLNLTFQFRAQGYPVGPTAVGAVLSAILWGSFLLFKDSPAPPPEAVQRSDPKASGRWPSALRAWLGVTGAVVTVAATLFLFRPDTGLRMVFPCLSTSLAFPGGVPPGLTHGVMAVGTHLTAVSIAMWIATAAAPIDPTLRRAAATAGALLFALMIILPLRGIVVDFGRACASSSILILSIPLLAGWTICALVSYGARPRGGRSVWAGMS